MAFRSCLVLLRRIQATRGRIVAFGAFGLAVIVAGIVVGAQAMTWEVDDVATGLVLDLGLTLLAPMTALVFASSCFGDLKEDQTMIYLWLRPVSPVVPVTAGWTASLTTVLPLVVIPMLVSAAMVTTDAEMLIATVAASTIAVVTYTAVFLTLGMVVRRALAWGLAYVLLWEGFVANAGGTPRRLAIGNYTRTVLVELGNPRFDAEGSTLTAGIVVPLIVTIVALAIAAHRFRVQAVD